MEADFAFLCMYITVCSEDCALRTVALVAQEKGLSCTTNRRKLTGCKHHKIFIALSANICVQIITVQITKLGKELHPRNIRFGGHRKRLMFSD